MRVKIIAAPRTSWYRDNIGDIISVEELDFEFYRVKGVTAPFTPLPIYKKDCEVFPDEQPAQPEPFDLERAKMGENVIEADGRHCTYIGTGLILDHPHFFNILTTLGQVGYIRVDDKGVSGGSSPYRLFMAPKEPQIVTKWVNVWGDGLYCSHTYDTKEEAIKNQEISGNNPEYGSHTGTFPIQITLNKQP